MKPFKVSIIVPVYNVEKYLPACLESLVSQTLDGVEIVAVNDGSTDGSLAILEEFRSRYPEKIFIYTTENHGVSHARNYGFSRAGGEYVWFVHSDDYVEKDACERLYHKAVSDGNDLVLFKYYNVDPSSGERRESNTCHYNQNFTIDDKPYELPAISPYPWIKFLKYELFQGLAFPEGIRFEDLPVAYLLAVNAASIGVVNECLYNYRKNVGFLGKLTPSTLDVKKAVIYMNEHMGHLGVRERYREELDFISVRHFFYRFWKMLTNYESGKKELKLRLINELFDYMEKEIPNWRENHYVRYSLPGHISRMFYLYGSREEMLRFVEACDGMEADRQKAWLREYKDAHEKDLCYRPADLIDEGKEACRAYEAAYRSGRTEKTQIFMESRCGMGLDSGMRAVLLYLLQKQKDYRIVLSLEGRAENLLKGLENAGEITLVEPGTEEYGKALALSGYLIADNPLPYYMKKNEGQYFLLLCGSAMYPLTAANSRFTRTDTGLWQHSMLLADCLYFTDEIIRRNYIKECMVQGICPTPYLVGKAPEKMLLKNRKRRVEIRRELGIREESQMIFLCMQPLGENIPESIQAYRSCMSALFQLDRELGGGQAAYLCIAGEEQPDFGGFSHIRPMPAGYQTYDLADACDVFVSDFHPGLVHLAETEKKVICFACDGDRYREDGEYVRSLKKRGVSYCGDVPELAGLLNRAGSTGCGVKEEDSHMENLPSVEKLLSGILNGEETTKLVMPEAPQRPRVLYYTGGKLSVRQIQEFNALAEAFPEKDFWLAFNDFRNGNTGKYLAQLAPGSSFLPLKPDPEKGMMWKIVSALITRAGFSGIYPISGVLSMGKKEYCRYLGNATFDEVIITATDNIKAVATLLGAAPKASYSPDPYDAGRYKTDRPFRHQIRFLKRLLDHAKELELPKGRYCKNVN